VSTTHPAAAPSAPSLPSRRGVVLPSVDRAVAARLVQVLGSGGWLVPSPDGGTVVTGDVVAAAALARVLSDEVAGRSAVVLWADPDGADADTDTGTQTCTEPVGPVAGFVVAHRDRVVTAHSWTTDGAGEEADAHVLAVALGRPDLEVGVRALLRRPSPDPQAALTEFVDLLGLPRGAVPLLSAAELPPSTEYVPPATGRRRLAAFRSTVAAQP
jgi:hypothetical protein